MYKAFSDPRNIEKMIRQVVVFLEEETLEVNLLQWSDNDPTPDVTNFGHWIKYVSTKSKNPREIYLYWDKKIEDGFLDVYLKKLLNESEYFNQLDEYFLKSYGNFKKLADEFWNKGAEYYRKLTNQQLINLFQEFSEVNKPAMVSYYIVYDCANMITRHVTREIDEVLAGLSKKERGEIFRIIATIGISTVLMTERTEFLKTLRKIQVRCEKGKNWKDRMIQSKIFNHWYKFGSCVYLHGSNKVYELEDYQKKFLKNIKLDAASELEKIRRNEKKDKRAVGNVLAKFNEHPEVVMHINWMRKMLGYRNREAEYYDNYFDCFTDYFLEIARRFNITLDEFWLLSKQEIFSGLSGRMDIEKLVKERKKQGFTIKQVGSRIKVWTGVKKEDWHEKRVAKTSSLKGNTAYKGKRKGVVKVIFHPLKEGGKFDRGNILVTSMTTPDFVPLMKKAKAVITDEGGLLCHAAIVARELKVPCIIGTKIATQILQDGQLVEVDAERGLVKILRSK